MKSGGQAIIMAVLVLAFSGCSGGHDGEYKPSKRALDLNNRSVHALAQKDTEGALSLVNEAIAQDPKFYKAYANKSAVLNEMGRQTEAIAALKQATALNPDYADAYVPLGLLLEKNGSYREALPLYEKAEKLHGAQLSRSPNDSNAVANRALALFLLRRKSSALDTLKEFLSKNPRDELALNIKAKIENADRDTFVYGEKKKPEPGPPEVEKK